MKSVCHFQNVAYISMAREPIDRRVSFYYWKKEQLRGTMNSSALATSVSPDDQLYFTKLVLCNHLITGFAGIQNILCHPIL